MVSVELDAVLERQPRLHMKAFVRLTIHTNSRVIGVQLMYNLVLLRLPLTNNETMKQFICRQCLCYHKFEGSLEVFLDHGALSFGHPSQSLFCLLRPWEVVLTASLLQVHLERPSQYLEQSPFALGEAWWQWRERDTFHCSLGHRWTSRSYSHQATWPWFALCPSFYEDW